MPPVGTSTEEQLLYVVQCSLQFTAQVHAKRQQIRQAEAQLQQHLDWEQEELRYRAGLRSPSPLATQGSSAASTDGC